ncbi:serine hydrolase [Mycobacteroides sp. CBMA 271]|uniref:serine hydrolase domain-containing protein n=2 Tax=unclassified Mycobacteroides TaxID=2618759 RepID=UPI001FB6C94E|nr:serine hydrolase domain-containing protein [Mycobacteroides sp. CBMA 271]
MKGAGVAGVEVAIVSKGTGAHYTAAFGFADVNRGRRLTVDTPVHLASVSKLFTAAALVHLFEERGRDLDSDINDFIDFSVKNAHYPRDPITPRQLLTHTSSISDGGYEERYETSGAGDPTQSLSRFLRDYLSEGGSTYSPSGTFLRTKPGGLWSYSNVAVALAGYVVEQVSQQPFASYVYDHVLGPLGIHNARWYLKDFAPDVLAKPYAYEKGEFVELPQQGYLDVPAGMLRCSVADLATSLRAMLGGEPAILSPNAVAAMLRRQVEPSIVHYQGLGWTEETIAGTALVGHSGVDVGATNMVVLTEDQRHAVAVLMNSDATSDADALRSSITADLISGAKRAG